MNTDKRTLIAIGLSLLIIMIWPYFYTPEPPPMETMPLSELSSDSLITSESTVSNDIPALIPEETKTVIPSDEEIEAKQVLIVDDYAERLITNKNGVRYSGYYVKKHLDHDGNYVELINNNLQNGYTATLNFRNDAPIRLLDLDFVFSDSSLTTIELSETKTSAKIHFEATVKDKKIYQTYTFFYNRYDYDLSFDFSSIESMLAPNGIQYQWLNGMPYTEQNSFEDENMSIVFMKGEDDIHRFDTDDPADGEDFLDKNFYYYVVRSKYFMTAVIPTYDETISKLRNDVHLEVFDEDTKYRKYDVSFTSNKSKSSFKLYIGPYDVNELDNYSFDNFSLSEVFLNASAYENTFRWITQGVHFLLLKFADVLGNFGLAIIFFTIFIKLILFPLTKKSYQGMNAMKEMQPKMAKIKEKYKDDPQLQQKKLMAMYQEEGVNPLGGCLPMLLQMPLLLALFQVFRASIEFRGASFLWIQDFAAPDAFPIEWLGLGIATVNLLPILLAVSQIWTSKQTMTDPNQKAMAYIMPVFFLFLFYEWNAALNFYYLLFNVLTSIQQKMISKPEKEAIVKADAKPSGYSVNDKANKIEMKKKGNMYKRK